MRPRNSPRLTTPADLVELIYSATRKVFIPSADHDRAGAWFFGRDAEILVCCETSNEMDRVVHLSAFKAGPSHPARPVEITAPPSGVCLIVSSSPQGLAEVALFKEWWLEKGGFIPESVEVPGSDAGDPGKAERIVSARLLDLVAAEASMAAAATAVLHGQISSLRQQLEISEGVVRSHRELLASLGGDRTYLAAAFTGLCGDVGPPPGENRVFTQPLPLPITGLTAFDLYCSSPLESKAANPGTLVVELVALDTNRTVASWETSYDRFVRGWLRHSLPASLAEPIHDFELRLSWSPGPAPRLGLATTKGMAAFSAPGELPDSALALMVWTGIPGATNTRMGLDQRRSEAAPAVVEFELTDLDFGRTEPTGSPIRAGHLRPMGGKKGLLLHPADAGRRTTAVLRSACPAGTDRIIAIGRVNHPDAASDVEYAICVLPAGRYHEFPEAPEASPDSLGFSPWTRVPRNGETVAIPVDFKGPAAGPADIHLATRVSPGADPSYCWAEWVAVRVRMRHSQPS